MQTTPGVFIIESFKFEDEEAGYPEGHFISHILRLAGRKVRYVYIKTRQEFEEVIDQFEDSEFRYYISHAMRTSVALLLPWMSYPLPSLRRCCAPSLTRGEYSFQPANSRRQNWRRLL